MLCSCFDSIQNLVTLKLENNSFELNEIKILSKNIDKLLDLRNIWIKGNNFGEEGVIEILDNIQMDIKKVITAYTKQLCISYSPEKLVKIIFLVKGEDRGRKAWYYLEIDKNNYNKFIAATYSHNINLDDYGKVIYSSYGDNPLQDLVDKMNREYPIVY